MSGALFGAGWWFWVDAVACNTQSVPFDQVRPARVGAAAAAVAGARAWLFEGLADSEGERACARSFQPAVNAARRQHSVHRKARFKARSDGRTKACGRLWPAVPPLLFAPPPPAPRPSSSLQYIPGIIATVALIMINCVRRDELQGAPACWWGPIARRTAGSAPLLARHACGRGAWVLPARQPPRRTLPLSPRRQPCRRRDSPLWH
jgi:hypothetical protein